MVVQMIGEAVYWVPSTPRRPLAASSAKAGN
jgi:hypothetical protein